MVSLKESFAGAAGSAFGAALEAGIGSPFEQQQKQAPTQSESVLTSLTGGKTSFKVTETPLQNVNTTSHNNVASTASVAKGAAQNVQAQAGFVKGQITQTIQQAQQQVHAVMKETGNGGSAVFMNSASASSDIASAVTGVSDGITQLLDALSDMRGTNGKDSAKVIAEIEDNLRAKSSSPSSHSLKGPGEETPQAIETDLDWNRVLDNHDLKEIMEIDASNPHQLPEWQEVCRIDDTANKILNTSVIAKNDADTDISTDPEHYCNQASVNLNSISQCQFEHPAIDDLVEQTLKNKIVTPTDAMPTQRIQQTMDI